MGPKNPEIDPSHPFVAPTGQRLESEGVAVGGAPGTIYTRVQGHMVHVYRDTWDTWVGLDRFSTPKNPQFDPSHPSVAPADEKLDSGGVAVGGAPGTLATRVQGHMKHLGMV